MARHRPQERAVLWKLALDGSGDYQRLTYFNEGGIYKASNPVVSDDGRYIAFQVPKSALIAGVGHGIYILDLEAAGLRYAISVDNKDFINGRSINPKINHLCSSGRLGGWPGGCC